ncbi:MAG: SCO6880 family protein [Actinomycetota bacterium]
MSDARLERMRVQYGPVEDRGILLGLRAGQLGAIATGLLIAAWTFSARPNLVGIIVAATALVAAGTLAFLQIEGRTVDQWVPIATTAVIDRVSGRWRHTATAPIDGTASSEAKAVVCPPPAFRHVRIIEVAGADGKPFGVLVDRQAGTYTGVAEVTGHSFYLADRDAVERRVVGWGTVLQAAARSGGMVHRLQWIDTAEPDDGTALWGYLDRQAVPDPPDGLADSYASLLGNAGPITQRHRVHVAVTVSAATARRAIKNAGGGYDGAGVVLGRTIARLREQMAAADLDLDAPLGRSAVAELVRTAFDPGVRAQLAVRARHDGTTGVGEQAAWPLTTTVKARAMEADGWVHRVLWVADWPRRPVPIEYLAHLMAGTTALRTVAVTLAPVDPATAAREVEQAVVQRLADEQLRTEKGFRTTSRRSRDDDALTRREDELADGHADYRFSAYLRISAPDDQQLEDAVDEVTQAANMSGLVLSVLTGQQDVAFAATLPTGRGVSR